MLLHQAFFVVFQGIEFSDFGVDNLPNAANRVIPLLWRGARQGGVVAWKCDIAIYRPHQGGVVA